MRTHAERVPYGRSVVYYPCSPMPSARRETMLLLVGDVLLLLLSLWLTLSVRISNCPRGIFLGASPGFVFVYAISLLIFFIAGLYERQTRLVKRILGVRIVGAQAANTVIAAVLFFLLPFSIAPKTVLAIYLLISVALISAWRFFLAPALSIETRQRRSSSARAKRSTRPTRWCRATRSTTCSSPSAFGLRRCSRESSGSASAHA